MLLLVAFGLLVYAQNLDDVTISGKVTDPNGLVVVGASVTVNSVDTGEMLNAVTNDEGRYRLRLDRSQNC